MHAEHHVHVIGIADVVIDNAHNRNESNNETNMMYAKNENSDYEMYLNVNQTKRE